MKMTPRLRKLLLTAHVTVSVGWMGAAVAYIALAITGITSVDAEQARGAYVSLKVIGWCIIVPASLASLLTGLVQSLCTEWGLFRHYWVSAKLLLTSIGTLILLGHMPAVSRMAGLAAGAHSWSSADFGVLPIQLVVHAAGGVLVLLAITTLSVFKPWGRTPYGRRKQRISSRANVGPRNEKMSVAKKPLIKAGQKVRLVNAPQDFSLDAPTTKATSADVVIVFAKNKAELDRRAAPAIEAADRRGRS